MSSPLLSVTIPTHNRARYAISAIKSILAISDSRLEVVISDTSSDGELAEYIEKKKDVWTTDPRLIYFRPEDKLDMTGNHNAVLGKANGDYICLIGDDDTITEDAIRAAEWAKEKCVDLIAPNVVANYVWPDFRSRFFGGRHASRLYISRKIRRGRFESSQNAIAAALRSAAQGTDGLPKIYHGIVSRAVLERVKKISGAYFYGSSPDVSGAIGLALCSTRFLWVDYPLTIPGASGGSNTGRSAMNTHKGKIEQESQTRGFLSGGWSLGVPCFFSVETVWAHAALETIARINSELQKEFNYARLIAACRVLHPEYVEEIEKATNEAAKVLGIDSVLLKKTIDAEIKKFKKERFFKFLKRLSKPSAAGGRDYVAGLNSVADAPEKLKQYMRERSLFWEQTIADISLESGKQ